MKNNDVFNYFFSKNILVVQELNRYIVGQQDAKKAVAIALSKLFF